jgi:type VI secretion system protein ImpC
LGDFSGRSGQVAEPGATIPRNWQDRQLRPVQVNRDNIEELPGKLGAQCLASFGDQADQVASLRFGRLSDFHPDCLLDKVPVLARLKDLRIGLQHPSTFEKAAAEVRAWGIVSREPVEPPPAAAQQEDSPPAALVELPPGASLLEQAIVLTTQPSSAPRGGSGLPEGLRELVRRSTQELRVPKAASDSATLTAAADAALGQVLRSILHDRQFQALEAAWRGLDFLVKRLPTGPKLKVFLVDYGLTELKTDLGSTAGLEATDLYQVLVEQTVNTPGGEPWGLIVADYTLQATAVDLLVGGCLARMAARAGAPLIAAASPLLVGCESLAGWPDPSDWLATLPENVGNAWQGLRSQAEAVCLGLVVPRFLLRMPYGPEHSPLESVPFNELPDTAEHEAFLWGNGALACAALLGLAFHEEGWRMRLPDAMVLDDLPVFGAERDGEYYLQPCAEALLSLRAAERILAAGLMPLLSVKGTGAVQLAGWRSVAASGAALAGRWA